MTIRVVVADDQATVRESLAVTLDLIPDVTVVGTAANGEEAVALVLELGPDVLLTDLMMPAMDGAAAAAAVVDRSPSTAVVVLSTYADESAVAAALAAGVHGYLTKDATRAEIETAIRAAAAGQAVFDLAVHRRLLAAAPGATNPTSPTSPTNPANPVLQELTPRELEVLTLIGEGLSNRQLARRLGVSEATVKTHVNHVFAKTDVRDRAAAVSFAYRHRLVRP